MMMSKLDNNNPKVKLDKAYQQSTEYMKLIELKFQKILENKALEINLYTEKLKVLNPLSIMEKGFSVVYKNGQIVKSGAELNTNDVIEVKFVDGIKKAKVMEE